MMVPGARTSAAINVTPLIDIVLVLLIIFMVMVPSSLKHLTATIPRPATNDATAATRAPLVKIGEDGAVTLDGEVVSATALVQRLRARLPRDATAVVFFDVDDGARYDAVVRVMDLARAAGARTLGIAR